uniref:Uncharacterized protein n=1 Tax=Knipowitschia caucasica TaxID=637954 RepID=A0AAV2IX26_KNICA
MPGDLGKATGQRGTASRRQGHARHRQTVCARQQTTRNEQHRTAEGPRGAARRRARRGGEQWGYANHSRCRDAEEEQTMSSQTEDSRATRTSNTLQKIGKWASPAFNLLSWWLLVDWVWALLVLMSRGRAACGLAATAGSTTVNFRESSILKVFE